mmetsp:Transcript_25810/g.65484  ORF Transcript_25810/g.65484 Transcript_25810/m.65484 type:complete len:238 (-) Transcript_25810:298-1011(-)
MLGRQAVRDLNRLGHRADEHCVAVLARLTRDGGGGEHRELLEQLLLHLRDERLGRRDELGQRLRVVLGLREQVGRYHLGRGRVVRDHAQLGRASEHVDRDAPGYQRLGRRHVLVARAAHCVRRAHWPAAVRECSDSVRATCCEQRVGAGDEGGAERDWGGSGRGDPHVGAARHARSRHRHDHTRGQRVATAGRVAARVLHRRDSVARRATRDVELRVADRCLLHESKAADAVDCAHE